MLYSLGKNIKKVIGVITLFHLLFLSGKAISHENTTLNNIRFSVSNESNLPIKNYYQDKKIKNNFLIKTPRSRRKYGLNETNGSLITFGNAIIFHFTSSIIVADFKNQLLQSSFSFSLLRGPPIV